MPTTFGVIVSEMMNEPMIRQIIDYFIHASKTLLDMDDPQAHHEAGVLLQTAANLETILKWKTEQ